LKFKATIAEQFEYTILAFIVNLLKLHVNG